MVCGFSQVRGGVLVTDGWFAGDGLSVLDVSELSFSFLLARSFCNSSICEPPPPPPIGGLFDTGSELGSGSARFFNFAACSCSAKVMPAFAPPTEPPVGGGGGGAGGPPPPPGTGGAGGPPTLGTGGAGGAAGAPLGGGGATGTGGAAGAGGTAGAGGAGGVAGTEGAGGATGATGIAGPLPEGTRLCVWCAGLISDGSGT